MKKLVLVSALVAASAAGASWIDDCSPMVGADIKWLSMKTASAWNGIFPKNYIAGDVYAGVKFHENFGLDVGYTWTEKKSHDDVISAGVPIGDVNGSATTNVTTKVELNGPYVDLMGYWPLTNCVDLFGSVGVGFYNLNLDIAPVSTSTTRQAGLSAITGDDKAVMRVGLGIRGMLNNWFGVRGKVAWENTSRLRLKDNKGTGFNNKPFKDAYSLAVGVFAKF